MPYIHLGVLILACLLLIAAIAVSWADLRAQRELKRMLEDSRLCPGCKGESVEPVLRVVRSPAIRHFSGSTTPTIRSE